MTKFGVGIGNCFQASLASILNCPLKVVPDFNLYGIDWYSHFLEWATNNNLATLFFRPENHSRVIISNCIGIGIWTLRDTDERHAVVMKYSIAEIESDSVSWKCEEIWDPNPGKPIKKDLVEHILIWKTL